MTIYTCENTFEAMMTCIYDAWDSKKGHQNIRLKAEPVGDMELFCEYRTKDRCCAKAKKSQKSDSFYPAQIIQHSIYHGISLCYVRTTG